MFQGFLKLRKSTGLIFAPEWLGVQVRVVLNTSLEGDKFDGKVQSFDDKGFVIESSGRELFFPHHAIKFVEKNP